MAGHFSPIPSPIGEPSQFLDLTPEFFYMNHMGTQTDMGAHHHRPLEMAVVMGGSALHRTTFGEAHCKPGQVYLIPPGRWHAYAHSRKLELYNCLLSRPLLDGPLGWAQDDPRLGALLNPDPWHACSQVLTWELPETALPKLRKLLEDLFQIYKESSGLRGQLVGRLLLVLDFIAQQGRPNYLPSPARVHSAVRRAVEMLRADLARQWSLSDLAEELRINPSYLSRLFQDAIDSAPMKFLARERAQKAAQLLLSSTGSVGEIGAKVGWDEPKQFARSFRQHFGESATEFRRRLQPT